MTKLFLFMASVAVVVSGAACNPAEPSQPSFAADARPIFVAHCVRCHGAGGMLHADPTSASPYNAIPVDGYFDQYDDQGSCPAAGSGFQGCKRGAHYYATTGKLVFAGYVDGQMGLGPMPPPPAPRLTTWEHDVLFSWVNNPIP
jgi:hypothetical protein